MHEVIDLRPSITEATTDKQRLLVNATDQNSDNDSTTAEYNANGTRLPSVTAEVNSPCELAGEEQRGKLVEFSDIRFHDLIYAKIGTKISVNWLSSLSQGQLIESFRVNSIMHAGRNMQIRLHDKDDDISLTFALSPKISDSVASGIEFEDNMSILIKWCNVSVHVFYNKNPLHFGTYKPIKPNDLTCRIENALTRLFASLELAHRDQGIFAPHTFSRDSSRPSDSVVNPLSKP